MAKEYAQSQSTAHDDAPVQTIETASGVRALEALLARGRPAPATVAAVLDTFRADRNEMLAMLHQSLGNAYVQEVLRTAGGPRAEESSADDAASPSVQREQATGAETGETEELVGDERGDGPAGDVDFDSSRAVRYAARDNARAGYCAKGVANVLSSQGFPVERGDATNWWRTLPRLGWRLLPGVGPTDAPEGAVLVFTNNRQAGRPVTRRRGGQLYGHVEIVGLVGNRRVYISDAVRNNYGGTVPQNFRGAYVYGDADLANTMYATGTGSTQAG